MAEFDEYDYLEKQLENKPVNGTKDVAEDANGADVDNKHRSKEKEDRRDKDKDRERDRDRDRKHRRRSRSDSRSRRRRRRSGSREKSKDRDRERRDSSRRHRSREKERSPPPKRRERTPPEVREQREREKELRELDRDIRTVFAYNLSLKADERDIFEFFSQAGMVVDVRIIMDRNTRRSKGFAYIEMANREDVPMALALSGQILCNQAVMVKSSEAEKNLAWEAAQQQNQQLQAMNALLGTSTGGGPCNLYVGNLHPNIAEADLKQLFEPFGPVDFVSIQKDASGVSYGFVQFQNLADASKAIQQLNGLELVGNKLEVKIAALAPVEAQQPMVAPNPAAAAAAALAAAQATTVPGELDDAEDDGGGMRLTANARAALMSRLAGAPVMGSGANTTPLGVPGLPTGMVLPGPPVLPAAQAAPPPNPLQFVQGVLGPASPIPTPCLLLKNMFDPAEETEPNWDQEIATDCKEECGKFGQVIHIHVDRNSKGFVYLKFASQDGSVAAQKALNGRWFAGRQVVAEFQFTQIYNNHFQC